MSDLLGSLFVKIAVDQEAFDKSLQNGESKFKAFSRGMTEKGKQLTASVTLPILAIGTALVKVASDAEETRNKFNTAFRGIEGRASTTAKALADGYGLARAESEKLLANTGDLLKGFGATADEALDLSFEVQKLAADLGSYNNLPTEQASQAITSALLGEREALKSLGVVVSEEAVKRQLALDGTSELTGELLLQAKAQATLKLITAQSGDAIGDFARSSDSVANTTKALVADFQNLAVELGQELLPIAKDILDFARGAIKGFSELSDGNKQLIITLAGIAAAAGPVLAFVGSLGTALTFLAANPIVLAVAGIAALVAVLVTLQSQYEKSLVTVNDYSSALEKTKSRSDELLGSYNKLAESNKTLEEKQAEEKKIQDELKALYPKLTTAKLNQAIANGTLTETIDKLNKAQAEEAKTALKSQREQLNTQLESLRKRIAEEQERLNTTNTGVGSNARGARAAAGTREEARKNIEALTKETQILAEALQQVSREEEELDKVINGTTETIVVQRTQISELPDETKDAEDKKTEAVEEGVQARLELYEKERDYQAEVIGGISDLFSSLIDLSEAQSNARIADLEGQLESEELTEERRKEIQKEINKEKRKQAEKDRALAIFGAGVNTAQAAIKALTDAPYPFNFVLAGLYAATGAAQIAAINAQPLPALAEGGFFNGPALIGEAGREFAFPLDGPQGQNAMELMANQLSKAMSKGGSVSNNSTINFSSTFDLGNEATKRKAAREIFPFIVEEQKRRGIA